MTDINTTAPVPKPKKKKGPIRFEAIIPFFIVVLVVWAYFFFFFDTHVRRAMEYGGTQINGAEVDIANVRSSFWNASLDINGIEVTDKEAPAKNAIQIGQMKWRMLWDALLRGKVAIEEASILEIAVGAPRKTPGRVLPPPPPPKDDGKPSAFEKAKKAALDKVQEEFDKNVLSDVAALLNGVDPTTQLKNIEGSLKSSARVKELQAQLTIKQKEWTDRIAKLPQQKDLDAIQAKLKGVKLDNFKSPMEVQASVQQIDSIYKEVDAKVKEIEATKNALTGDVGTYQNTLGDLEKMVQQDIKDLESRVKLPKLDVQSLSRSLFGPLFLNKVKQAEFYMTKARQYMPPKKTAAEKAEIAPPTPHEREKGRNYKFGHQNTYPLFWLHKAQISSKVTPGATWSGNLTGTLQDVTDDPPTLGRPTLALFKGDFPQQELFGVDGKITIDHVTEKSAEKLDLNIGSFPVADRVLVNSPDVKLAIANAAGSTAFNAELSEGNLKITTASSFSKRTGPAGASSAGATAAAAASPQAAATSAQGTFLASEAKQPILADILRGALADIPKVTLNASVNGSWTDPKFDIDSNLGRDLAKAFEKQIQAKLAEARAKLQSFINDQIGKQKDALTAQFNSAKGQVDALLKQKQAEVDKAKGTLDKAKNDALNSQKKGLEQEGKNQLDKLKKGFGF